MKSFIALWRSESWSARLILVAAVLLGVLSTVNLLLDITIGFFGVWHLSVMTGSFSSLIFAVAMYESVYWRRRALNAEKPYVLPIRQAANDPVVNITAGLNRWHSGDTPDWLRQQVSSWRS